jgi:hypothetical protein
MPAFIRFFPRLIPPAPTQDTVSPDRLVAPTNLPVINHRGWIMIASALLLSALPLVGADWAMGKNRLSVQSHIGFNITADFTQLGSFASPADVGPAHGGADHFYDDGYNRVDSRGNPDGQTWFWGYDNANQIVGSNVLMSSTSTLPGAVRGISDAPHWGVELNYARELGWNGSYWWGVEIGLSWVNLNFSERRAFASDAVRTVDSYPFGESVPPAPYAGTFAGPGPTIGDNPQRTIQTLNNAALTTGSYDLDASLYALRLGLIYETPFTDWFTLQFGGGVIGAFIHGDFAYRESTFTHELGSTPLEFGSDRERDFLGGAYARAGLGLHFSPNVMASLGLQYNYLGTFSQQVDGRHASIDLKTSLYLAVGVGVSF